MAWGKCPCCGEKKDFTKDHVKDDLGRKTGKSIVICSQCHVILENYRRELTNLRKASAP